MTAEFGAERIDLAKEGDFRLGGTVVRPSTRQIVAGGVPETLEPRVLQVLVALARRRGEVISRDELIETCWEGRIVGDDALNRCISRIRKLGEANGAFDVETVPRVGYKLREIGAASGAASLAADPAPALAAPPGRSRRTLVLAISGLVVAALALVGWMTLGPGARAPALERSIAVLPFANLTGDPGKDYIARGVSVEIIEQLSQLQGVKVISRNSSFTYGADADPRKVGEDLKVANVLSGTVKEEKGRIAISAELADARTGAAILQRFSPDVAGGAADTAQRLIAQRVAGAMSIAFDLEKRSRPTGTATSSLKAYDIYQQALDQWWYKGNRKLAEDMFKQAADLDPSYAEAWAGQAIAAASQWGGLSPVDAQKKYAVAYQLARRAVDLDPDLSVAQAVLGAILTTQKKWNDAETATVKALAISRNEMALNNRQMMLLRAGRLNDAYETMLELRRVDPLRGSDSLGLSGILSGTGRHEELREIMSRPGWSEASEGSAISRRFFVLIGRINADDPPASIRQALEYIAEREDRAPAEFARAVLAVFDNPVKAREMLNAWYADPTFTHSAKWDLIPPLAAWYGDTDLVLRVWQYELPLGTGRTAFVWGPVFATTRKRPEFGALMQEIGLVDYWRGHTWPDKCRPLGATAFECG